MSKTTKYIDWLLSNNHGETPKNCIDLIVESWLIKAKQNTFPVKLSKIAKVIGIDPHPLYFDQQYDGSLVAKDGKLRIALKLSYRENYIFSQRLRFTYAHELIHCLAYDLTSIPNKRIAPSPDGMEEEHLCNYGASKLILPTRILSEYLFDQGAYSLLSSSEKIKTIANQANCSISTVAIELIKSDLLVDKVNKIYILSQTSSGYRNSDKLKPRCVISAYFDANGKKHLFLGPDKGLEHVRTSTNLAPWSLLQFHEDYFNEYRDVKEERLIRTTDSCPFTVKGTHVRLSEKGYIWTELSIYS